MKSRFQNRGRRRVKWIEIEPVDWLIIGLRVDAVEGADEGDGFAVVVEATDRFRRRRVRSMPMPGNGPVPRGMRNQF